MTPQKPEALEVSEKAPEISPWETIHLVGRELYPNWSTTEEPKISLLWGSVFPLTETRTKTETETERRVEKEWMMAQKDKVDLQRWKVIGERYRKWRAGYCERKYSKYAVSMYLCKLIPSNTIRRVHRRSLWHRHWGKILKNSYKKKIMLHWRTINKFNFINLHC